MFFTVRQNAKSSFELELTLVRPHATTNFIQLNDTAPETIVVVGENESAFIASVLRDAFGADTVLLHKRIFRRNLLSPNEIEKFTSRKDRIWVAVVDAPCNAVDGIIRARRKACREVDSPSERCKLHDFASEADVYRMPWLDIRVDSDDNGIVASDPEREIEYKDIFDMRRKYLLLLKQLTEALPRHVKILRRGDFDLNPDAFVSDLVKEYALPLSKTYTPALQGVNAQSTITCMDYATWREAQQRIDWSLEGYFGFTSKDCHYCRASKVGSQTWVTA